MSVFRKSDFFMPYLNLYQNLARDARFKAGHIEFSSFSSNFTETIVLWIEKFKNLETKVRYAALITIALIVSLIFFSAFSPLIAVLGLIIFYEIIAILWVNLRLHLLANKCAYESFDSNQTGYDDGWSDMSSLSMRIQEINQVQYMESAKKFQ